MDETQEINEARKQWMSVLAKAPPQLLKGLSENFGNLPSFDWLRPPEIGGVMVRGRMGGTGEPFNVGEMTVTRCALRLESGEVGHAYVQGRDKEHAKVAAVVDAMMQTTRSDEAQAAILDPLEEHAREHRKLREQKAGATKVDFFTMVRGED